MHNRRLAATHARNDGRPRRHGPRFVLSNPDTWPTPATEHHTTDTRYGMISVQAWPDMHPKLTGRERWANHELPPIVHGTVICVEVEHLPDPPPATSRPSGCGGQDPAKPTSTSSGAPTCDASTSNTLSATSKAPSAGPPPACVHPNKPTDGPGSPSPPTPNSVSPDPSSRNTACPGNDRANRTSSHQHAPTAGFLCCAPPSAHPRTHRNPTNPDPADPKAPENHHEPATPPSGKPPDHPPKV